MSSNSTSGKVVSADEQAFERADERDVDDDGVEVVDEMPAFRATVDMEVQAKVDANHPEGIADTNEDRISGVTREQEERIRAREAELERISTRAERGTPDGRARGTRELAAAGSQQRRDVFQRRAASVDPAPHVEPDPRAELSRDELAAVNEQATRLAVALEEWSRAAIGRRLAEAVVDGRSVTSAVVGVVEHLRTASGTVVPIGKLEDVSRQEVSIDRRVETLWNADSAAIQQVGLIEDESGRTKLTVWKKSNAPWIEEGERVRIHGAAKNWSRDASHWP